MTTLSTFVHGAMLISNRGHQQSSYAKGVKLPICAAHSGMLGLLAPAKQQLQHQVADLDNADPQKCSVYPVKTQQVIRLKLPAYEDLYLRQKGVGS